ncbi:MAG: ABC transporter ATP-binding protein [Betaproteobacteria bacterium]|nr:ABC transporter ATP-binding protein [Betaproteobacteria bacterium]
MNDLLEMRSVDKRYGRTRVLRDVTFSMAPGEFVVLIGGSGSGKTTLLRLIGGLERLDGGIIRLRGRDVDAPAQGVWAPPERRGLGMVFQEYALWPHLSCRENVAAVIPGRGPERNRLAEALLERIGVGHHADKRPAQLSGGEQQRVGIARALAARPNLLLFDEALSSLDVDAREFLRLEIRALTREFGAGALFVSHDPLDAWRMADRIAVLENGALTQTASPQALYASPATAQVARFIGAQGGFMARVRRSHEGLGVELGGRFHRASVANVTEDEEACVFIRPAGIRVDGADGIPARLVHCVFEAGVYRAYWQLSGINTPLCSYEAGPPAAGEGRLHIAPEHIFVFPSDGDHSHV